MYAFNFYFCTRIYLHCPIHSPISKKNNLTSGLHVIFSPMSQLRSTFYNPGR